MKTLVIAEKPSVARDIARVLGNCAKEGEHYESEQYVIAAAAGHLVELFMPEDIDAKRYKFWQLRELPIMPETFQLKPIAEKRNLTRFKELVRLIRRKDVDRILNACDAGREGELIFTYIYELAGVAKPWERVWMQSMTRGAISEAFRTPRGPREMQGLSDAARSRSEADWLIGINGTRAVTKRLIGRGKGVATIGRVQTPTLSIVFRRELEIRGFVSRDFWRIRGTFALASGNYEGWLQRETRLNKADNHDRVDRFWDQPTAAALLDKVKQGGAAQVEDKCKRTRQAPGRLYDLTSLQREANSRFGFSAVRTLQVAQSLYERHKLLTYPRTDARVLPEDYIPTVRDTLGALGDPYRALAAKVLTKGWVRPDKRIFNNAGVSDHFAIVPTGEQPGKLTTDETKIYDMVTRRFISVFYPPAEFDVTTRTSTVAGCRFLTEGKVLVEPGFLEVYGKESVEQQLPPLGEADRDGAGWRANCEEFELLAEQTKPPARFTEATLLAAMEGAGKLVEDEDMAEAMKESGLGTPATRASTIDHLINEKYMERDGRYLLPTAKAERILRFLEAAKVEALTQPDLTGEWEHKLLLMEHGKLARADFMRGIRDLTTVVVERIKGFTEQHDDAPESCIISPSDGKPMRELLQSYRSQDGALNIYKSVASRVLSTEEIQTLLDTRQVGPLDGFRSRLGRPFSAILRLDPMNKVVFDFGERNGAGEGEGNGEEQLDPATLPVVGIFRETGETVYETPKAYACARSLRGEREGVFRLNRNLLHKDLPREEVARLLESGRTGLITGFRSKRTGRNFDAHLILHAGAKLGFEFPPRDKDSFKKGGRRGGKKGSPTRDAAGTDDGDPADTDAEADA
jgi:DNA topoisomerase-3